ncbi:GntR family transcriptional regulator [Actinoplanes lutulentus]|uniref:GntR family transcriptional regulator n=1 Tax=Actinoplanes lutulentus TaxID=1287878 RepID=A0A327ZA62_9ACTN|nr:GntR family transcriptional regulator [Actinoplanes lutulentus]
MPSRGQLRGQSATEEVHRLLREDILNGRFTSGEVLEQDKIGRLLGVSATPIREALRRLQEEGLVVAPPQRRARVVGFDPAQVEALYAERICIEAMGAALTARVVTDESLMAMRDAFQRMQSASTGAGGPDAAWHAAHFDFHMLATDSLGQAMQSRVAINFDRSRHYVQMQRPEALDGWRAPNRWHGAILAAFEARDPDAAGAAMASDLANAAVALIGYMTPDHEPTLITSVVERFHQAT